MDNTQNTTQTVYSDRPELGSKLAAARQSLMLLKSQIRAGEFESNYWALRLDELNDLLAQVVQERLETDQKQRLAALYEVSRALGSSLDLDEVLNEVMDAIIQLTRAERGFLMLFESGKLQVKAARNVAKETLSEEDFAFSRSVIRTVAETGNQVVTTNASEDPRFKSQASVVANNLRSIQCVPLRARGNIIGVIYVDNTVHVGVFEETDLEMLSTFASQAAVAIENARLFTMTDQALAARVEELSVMQEIDKQLNATLDFQRVMDLTLNWAVRATHSDNGAIGVRDLDTGEIEVVSMHGQLPEEIIFQLDSDLQNIPAEYLAVAIQREGRIIGVIITNRNDGTTFSPLTRDFVQRLGDHAAIAIENAQLYDAVRRANDAKTEFVSIVTHELRLPMTAIKGYTDMVLLSPDASDKHKGYLKIVRNNVDRMAVLVSDLSDISRIEAGRLAIEVEDEVELREVLEDSLAGMKAEIEQREHEVVIDIDDDLSTVRVDSRRLQQIFTNLISNAYKYTPDGGSITISAVLEGDYVLTSVTDTGIGMTPEELDNLFTKFWRADQLHVREQHGTGLGLAIAKNLIEMHGGEMGVTSEKDVGTTFSFTLPSTAADIEIVTD